TTVYRDWSRDVCSSDPGPLTLGLLAGACLTAGGLLLRHEHERSPSEEAMPFRSRAQLVALVGGGILLAAAVLVLLDAARAFAVQDRKSVVEGEVGVQSG